MDTSLRWKPFLIDTSLRQTPLSIGNFSTRRASRGHEAARSEKLLRLLSDRAQTLHNDRTFYSKQSYRFCFFILTVFGGEMTSRCKRQIFNCLLWHKKYMILKELIEIK